MTRDEQQAWNKLKFEAERLRRQEGVDPAWTYDPRHIGEAVSKAVNPAMRDQSSNHAHMLIGGNPHQRICAQPLSE
jgi:hypothetical protein